MDVIGEQAFSSIEGNKLSFAETEMVVTKNLTIEGISLDEHIEAKNLMKAVQLANSKLKNKEAFNENLVKDFHRHITKGLLGDDLEGDYKKRRNILGNIKVASPNAVPKLMKELFSWYKENNGKLHPLELATIFKYRFVVIHPYYDGNGRTSRLAENYILGLHGYPPIIINPKNRVKYYKALNDSTIKDCSPLIKFMSDSLLESIDEHLELLSD